MNYAVVTATDGTIDITSLRRQLTIRAGCCGEKAEAEAAKVAAAPKPARKEEAVDPAALGLGDVALVVLNGGAATGRRATRTPHCPCWPGRPPWACPGSSSASTSPAIFPPEPAWAPSRR